jgi:hypothetical protein
MAKYAFRVPLGIQLVLVGIIFRGVLYVGDSPTFYLTKSQEEKALKSLRQVRQNNDEASIAAEIVTLKAQTNLREDKTLVSYIELFNLRQQSSPFRSPTRNSCPVLSSLQRTSHFSSAPSAETYAFTMAMAAAVLVFAEVCLQSNPCYCLGLSNSRTNKLWSSSGLIL